MFSMWARAQWARVAALGVAAPLLVGGMAPVSAQAAEHRMTPAYDSQSQVDYVADFQPDVVPAKPTCLTLNPIACFAPDTIRSAYGFPAVDDPVVNGAGRTIVIIEAFQSPTISDDLKAFDHMFRVPDPAKFVTVTLPGTPPFNPNDPHQFGWWHETAIDVEWAHAIAPLAGIILVQAISDKDADMVAALQYAVHHNLGDVISQSFGEAEACADAAVLRRQHAAFEAARKLGITVFASSGDQGAARQTCDGKPGSFMFGASTPASDPEVTAVGGTQLLAVPDGMPPDVHATYISETAWNTARGASGGGFSAIYRRPGYQAPFQKNNKARGLPDVAYDAANTSGFVVTWNGGGFLAFGTSAGTPQWAGIAALADQVSGHRLGSINSRLYKIARSDAYARAFHDVTTGNNSFGGFTGYAAGPGWDPVTGLGTPKVANLIQLLRHEGDGENGGNGQD
jgi:subtilase family serine protease